MGICCFLYDHIDTSFWQKGPCDWNVLALGPRLRMVLGYLQDHAVYLCINDTKSERVFVGTQLVAHGITVVIFNGVNAKS